MKQANNPPLILRVIVSALCLLFASQSLAHEGPDPAGQWVFTSKQFEKQQLKAIIGPNATLTGQRAISSFGRHEALAFDGVTTAVVVGKDLASAKAALPSEAFTITAVVSVDQPMEWGGIIGAIQDNGGFEKGWVLGFDNRVFSIGLSTVGADDGDGRLTYLKGKTKYQSGRFYHVAATYNGKTLSLYVDGKLEATTTAQSGKILYPDKGGLVIGGYRDSNENHPLRGRISGVTVYHHAATAKWVKGDLDHYATLLTAKVQAVVPTGDPDKPHEVLVEPFLQYATTDRITVTWETNQPAKSVIHWGTDKQCKEQVALKSKGTPSSIGFVHQGRIEGLKPHTQYFYYASSIDDQGRAIKSEVRTFQTAPDGDTPFAFTAISDTQGNYPVARKIAELAWGQRPSFLLHPGDLVSTGSNKSHWTKTFFPSMAPLISRVPIYPVLGNHEQDAAFYYHYMDLPDPEYYYTFKYANAQFFMIDTNRNVGPDSEQYKWLDAQLAQSKADWKIVCHHHPPYSSDENDYGNLWQTNVSSRGDTRARQLTKLYDKHKVDLVWTGHIHSYERTWPMRDGKPTDGQGTRYMVTGGGGGGLETPGPFRTAFSNVVRRGHHYTMVHVNGKTLEARAFTDSGELFDTFTLRKTD